MGTCMSKKKRSCSSSSSVSATKLVSSSTPHLQPQAVTVFKSEVEPEREASLKKENKQEDEGRVKKEVFIIKHRKSYSDGGGGNGREKISNVAAEAKEVDEILLECGRLSRNSSGKAVSSSERGRRRRHSKRSHDLDHCENDNPTTNAIGNIGDLLCEDDNGLAGENRQHRHRRRSPSERRRRTPSRERDQQQRSSSRERRVSRSPGKRSSDTTTTTCNLTNNSTTTRPGKMLSVPPTVSSLSMDKSNNGGGGGIVRVSVKRNVGSSSPRSVSPARANGKLSLLSENQQQQQASSMSRYSSRNAEQSPYRRHPLTEIDGNSLAYSLSANNNSGRFQSRSKREIEPQASQKTKVDTNNNIECRTSRVKKEQKEEEEVKEQCSMSENVNLKRTTVVPPPSGIDNLKHQTLTLTRNRSSRRSSRDLDHILNNETVGIPSQSYTSLLLEDIQNFHQKNNNNNAPSNPLPACVAKACSILEAVADLNASTTRSNLAVNHYAKRVPDCSIKEQPFVETEVDVTDDVMEPSLQKYVTTVSRGDSLIGVGGGLFDMEDKECSASEQRHMGFPPSSSSMKPNSGDLTDFRNSSRRRECDFQRTGSGRFGDIKDVHAIPT